MKTTIDLPDELVRAIKIRAVEEDKSLKCLVAELLERALEASAPRGEPHYMQFPIVRRTRRVPHVTDPTPEELKQILLDQDIERALRS